VNFKVNICNDLGCQWMESEGDVSTNGIRFALTGFGEKDYAAANEPATASSWFQEMIHE
jgi:hypothetical protein